MASNLFTPFLTWWPSVNRNTLKADVLAGLTGAIIVLPQGIAYAMIAGLPPVYGLYTAIVPAILAAMFGSSRHLISGPTAALSVIVFTTISPFAEPGTPLYIQLCLTLTLCAGILQLLMGMLRFGAVVNFVSHSVVLGFTAGAAVVISASQLKHVFGLEYQSGSTAIDNLILFANHIGDTNVVASLIGLITIAVCVLIKRVYPKLPNMLFAMLAAMALAYLLNGQGQDVRLVGEVSSAFLQLSVPGFDWTTIESMATGIIAVALLGLVEAISIGRSVALKSKQRIDSNQEFVGQGVSNIAGAFFSCYVSSGSFTRSGVNYTSGAQTPLASVFAALFLLLIMMFFADYAAYIPIAGMGGLLLVVAYNLVDVEHIKDVIEHDKKEALVLVSTFIAALFLHLELSIYVGVAVSLYFYLRKTSRPQVDVLDEDDFEDHYPLDQDTKIVRINGSIFFGCVQHLDQELKNLNAKRLIILGRGINFIDHLGVQMLDEFVSQSQQDIYFCRFKSTPKQTLLKQAHHINEEQFNDRLTPLLTRFSQET